MSAGGGDSRRRDGDKLVFTGRQPVQEALRAGHPILEILIAEGTRGAIIDEISAGARERGVPVRFVSRHDMDEAAGHTRHQGVQALAAAPGGSPVDEILEQARAAGEDPFLLVAAGILDPRNLGSLIRTAEGVGMHGVIIPKHRAAGITATVAKASAGAVFHIPIATVTNVSRTMRRLKEEGLWFAAAHPEDGTPLHKADLSGPLGIVIGGEGAGIPRLVLAHCDFSVSIPMRGKVDSLNASVAGALLMYEALRRRRGNDGE